jgi:anthranilate phosphoribosyltransferase
MPRGDLGDLVVENAQQSLALIQRALRNEAGSASDILALNAGAAIYAADICSELSLGVAMAQDLMSSGQAEEKFREFIQFTQLVAQQDN